MAVAALGLIIAVLPAFMLGGLSVQVRAEMGFSETALGGAITVFFVAAGLTSIPGGRLGDHVGARRALVGGSAVTAVGLLMIASAGTWVALALGLAVAGVAVGLTEPGIAATLARLVPSDRQGVAFGVKEASIPGATLLAGAAVPAVALTVGWRWAFAGAVLLVPVLWVLVPSDTAHPRPRPEAGGRTGAPVGPLSVVAAGSGLGVGAVTAMSAFLVEAAVRSGVRPGMAGLLLSGGSLAGIVSRVSVGWLADRTARSQLPVVAVMLTGGAGALGLLALAGATGGAGSAVALVTGAVLAFSVGWGWTGLLFLSAVRASPQAPASAAGIALAGLSVGGAGGPLLFGMLVSSASFAVAWTVGAATMLAGAVLVSVGGRMLLMRAEDAD